jgi:hypothetical protein
MSPLFFRKPFTLTRETPLARILRKDASTFAIK